MKILVIEDEKAMSDLIAIKFKIEGFEVDQAGNLAEAKERVSAGVSYDVILSDYLMPDGDLTDFLTGLRAIPQMAKVPVVVMTNYVEDVNLDQLKSLGVVDILTKYQVVPAQMVEKVKQLLAASQPVAEAAPTIT